MFRIVHRQTIVKTLSCCVGGPDSQAWLTLLRNVSTVCLSISIKMFTLATYAYAVQVIITEGTRWSLEEFVGITLTAISTRKRKAFIFLVLTLVLISPQCTVFLKKVL